MTVELYSLHFQKFCLTNAIEHWHKANPTFAELFTWISEHFTFIEVNPSFNHDLFADLKASWLLKNIKMRRCYKNAHRLHRYKGEIEYVEGFCIDQSDRFIAHAWNHYQGTHFDLTNELLGDGKWFKAYFQVICLNQNMLTELKPMVGYWGEHILPYFTYKMSELVPNQR